MFEGVDANGNDLDTYSPTTEFLNEGKKFGSLRKSKTTDTKIFLFDTGDFHDDIFVKFDKYGFKIWSKDSKTDSLVAEFGDIFGFNDDTLYYFITNHFKPMLQKECKNMLDL